MWLFTRYGFYSVACAEGKGAERDPGLFMIRARKIAHLKALRKRFPELADCSVTCSEHRDYRYRIFVAKVIWMGVMSELASEQTWSNFKNETARFQGAEGDAYLNALHQVWSVMFGLQRE